MENYRYVGLVFSGEGRMKLEQAIAKLPFKRLENPVGEFVLFIPGTCFIENRAKNVHEELFGSEVTVQVIGYGRSEEAEAFRCEFLYTGYHPEFDDILRRVEIPHITISLGKEGRDRNSASLAFRPISEPFFITGKYQGFNTLKEITGGDKK